ncbi:hypothetical protein R3P38DRAFT_3201118 [Favolaschia claudopus]|uniref:Uncharacterized protein n=1 Tax=Favolaschia claudopus TaxID=2862362 RepID=A0AAW0AXZ4_9AGAR
MIVYARVSRQDPSLPPLSRPAHRHGPAFSFHPFSTFPRIYGPLVDSSHLRSRHLLWLTLDSAAPSIRHPSRPIPSPGDALDIPQPRSPRLNSLPHRTMSLPLSERTTLKLTFFKVTLPDVLPDSIRQARGTTSQRWLISALPFSTSSPFDVDDDPRLNAHASHPLAPSSKSASFMISLAPLANPALYQHRCFSNSSAGSFLDATSLRRPPSESLSSTVLPIHSVISTLNASPSSQRPLKLRQSRHPISIAWRRDLRHSAPWHRSTWCRNVLALVFPSST